MHVENKRLIESEIFTEILREVDEKAKGEKSPNRPAYWDMIFWWSRKPLISARIVVASSLLPEDYPIEKFREVVKLKEKQPHKHQPVSINEFTKITLLDPFAGFGSIPLEAKRLGVGKIIASDLLPTAYIFLKTVLDYPDYGEKLIMDVKKYGEELIKSLENDIKELYGNYSGFVGTWEVKCPKCGNYTPLVYQWWLIREKEKVYMKPETIGNQLRVRVIKGEGKPPEGNVKAKNSFARCLFCNTILPGKKDKWYVKEALLDWDKKYEEFMNGKITINELKNAKARPTLLVKFRGNKEFEEVTKEDLEKLWDAFEKLRGLNISTIPTEDLPRSSTRSITWGMDKFYKLFNARQLLIMSKIVTRLNELKEKISGDDKYKEAVITYLTIVFLNHLRHNCMLTAVHPSKKFVAHALAFRGLSLTWNWVEVNPISNMTGSLTKSLENVIEGLEYLIRTRNDNSNVIILNVDVNELDLDEKVDVIITDPPYADDVPYPEVSDFYYVWLKKVIPFPYKTQWEELVPKDIGVEKSRRKVFGGDVGTYEYSREKLAEAFKKLTSLLKDDGLLVTFYNHSSLDAWVSLVYAGWYISRLRISAIHSITTESRTRINAKTTRNSLNKSIIIVWRKGANGIKTIQEVKSEAVSKVTDWVRSKQYRQKELMNIDTFIEVFVRVLSIFTQYEKILGLNGDGVKAVEDLVKNHVYETSREIMENLIVES